MSGGGGAAGPSWARIGAAAALTAGFAGLAWWAGDLAETAAILFAMPAWAWSGLIVLSGLMTALRFLRIAVAVDAMPDLPLFRACAIHGAALAILPARTGEAAFPLAIGRLCGRDAAGAVGALVAVRLTDLTVLCVLASMLLLYLTGDTGHAWLAPAALVAAAAALALWIALPWLLGVVERAAGGRLKTLVRRIADGAVCVGMGARVRMLALAMAIWAVLALAGWAAAAGAGLAAPFAHGAAAGVAASFAFALPISGLANAGPFEAAFAGVLVALGHPLEAALAAAIALHLAAAAVAVGAALVGEAASSVRRERSLR